MTKADRRKISVVAIHYLDNHIINTEIVSRILKFKNNKEYANYAGRDREISRKLGIATIEYKSVTISGSGLIKQCWWCNQEVGTNNSR